MSSRRRGREGGTKRRAKRTVLIVTNGEETEYQYLTELKRRAASRDLAITVEFKPGEPATVVRKYSSPAGDPSGYDEVWFVFDEDGKDLTAVLKQIRANASKSWNCVISRPCFEVWLTAHYRTIRDYADQTDAQRHYESVSGVPRGTKDIPNGFPYDDMIRASERCMPPGEELPQPNQVPTTCGSSMPYLLRSLGLNASN